MTEELGALRAATLATLARIARFSAWASRELVPMIYFGMPVGLNVPAGLADHAVRLPLLLPVPADSEQNGAGKRLNARGDIGK